MENKRKGKNYWKQFLFKKGSTFQHSKSILLFFSFLMFCSSIHAQQTVTGRVIDEKGEAAIGVSVLVQGSNNGAITDLDGEYTLSNVSLNSSISFTYIGYQTQTVTYTGQRIINITLQEDAQMLDELVVIGYGSVKKSDATGSVTAIKADLDGRGLAPNAQDMMVGKIAGVNVTSDGGSPSGSATIRIRGGSSLSANNDPLIVVDGIPLSGGPNGVGNMLSSINPTDIETFTVLKDASATAIYGSRASNGVIIITTKKGTSGKLKITYDGNVSVSHRKNEIDVLSGDEFRDFVKQTFAGATNEAEVVGKLGEANTNWQDEIFRDAVSTEQNLSFYGSVGETMPYRVSLGYTNLNGILKTSKMERYTGSFALSPTLLDKHLNINLNGKGMFVKSRFADQGSIGAAVSMDPTHPVRDYDSSFDFVNNYWSWLGGPEKVLDVATRNPVAMLEMRDDNSIARQFIGNAQFDYKLHFLPELHFNLNLGLDFSDSDGDNKAPANSPMEHSNKGYHNQWYGKRTNTLLDFYAQYKKDLPFLESSLDVMGGYSYQYFKNSGGNTATRLAEYESDGSLRLVEDNVYENDLCLISFFGRLNYNILSRYLFTFTLRDDGSSRFHKDNRWGLFPAAALAWRINDESFLKDIDVVSNLKLRLGWGITGQQDIGELYPSLSKYQTSTGTSANYYRNGEWIGLIKPLSGNPDLKWEETTTYNAGIDFGFLNNRISGAVDVYFRKTKDLFNAEAKVAAGSNFSEYVMANIGTLENKGVEFTLNAIPIVTNDFTWEAGINFAYNKNEITELTLGDNKSAMRRFGNTGGDGGFQLMAHTVGNAHSMYYVYEQIYDENGLPLEGMYVDRNNDGMINEQDLYLYHKPTADFTFGFNTKFIYKDWDLSMASHGSLGNYNYNAVAANNAELGSARVYNNEFLGNRVSSAFDTQFLMKQVLSDYYVQDASFYRIDNITLGWSFKKSQSIPVSGRLYGSVQNPFVFTKYDGLDPEVFGGVDNNFYPRPVSFLFGVNLNF